MRTDTDNISAPFGEAKLVYQVKPEGKKTMSILEAPIQFN